MTIDAAVRLLTIREVMQLTGMSKAYIYALAKAGRMPRPIKCGWTSRWRSDQLQDWIKSLPAAALGSTAKKERPQRVGVAS